MRQAAVCREPTGVESTDKVGWDCSAGWITAMLRWLVYQPNRRLVEHHSSLSSVPLQLMRYHMIQPAKMTLF